MIKFYSKNVYMCKGSVYYEYQYSHVLVSFMFAYFKLKMASLLGLHCSDGYLAKITLAG